MEASGDIVVADYGVTTIFRVDPTLGSQATVSSGGDFVAQYDVIVASVVPEPTSLAVGLIEMLFITTFTKRYFV